MNINWKVRFNAKNKAFLVRLALALLVPILGYYGLKFEDFTSWTSVGKIFMDFLANPYLVGLTIFNALNMLPDPTTPGISDSEQALTYTLPK